MDDQFYDTFKEYVKHLRLIHFSLVITCVTLIIFLMENRQSSISEAKKELDEIIAFLDSHETYEMAVSQIEAKLSEDVVKNYPYLDFLRYDPPLKLNLSFSTNPKHGVEVQDHAESWYMRVKRISIVNDTEKSLKFSDVSTIYEFKKRYTSVTSGCCLRVISGTDSHQHQIPTYDRPSDEYHAHFNKPGEIAETPWLLNQWEPELLFLPTGEPASKDYKPSRIFGLSSSVTTVPEIPNYPILFDVLEDGPNFLHLRLLYDRSIFDNFYFSIKYENAGWQWRPLFKLYGWTNAEFERQFYNLNKITRNWQDIKLADARKIIDSEFEREPLTVGFFSLSMSRSMANNIGLLLILILQAYMFMHLRSFMTFMQTDRELLMSGQSTSFVFNYPWVGLYNTHLARLASLCSIVALPGVTAIVIIFSLGLGTVTSFAELDFVVLIPNIVLAVAVNTFAYYLLQTLLSHNLAIKRMHLYVQMGQRDTKRALNYKESITN